MVGAEALTIVCKTIAGVRFQYALSDKMSVVDNNNNMNLTLVFI